jgi:thioredoxin reductase (NADPH)
MKQSLYNVVIIGSGPAGLTAGIYAARAGLNPCIIEGKSPGGQLMTTTVVENWPGIKSIMGPKLMADMREQAQAAGCAFYSGSAKDISVDKRPFTIVTSEDVTLQARTVIVATGANPKRLKVPGEDTYWGRGVTPCAVCDGALYRDLPVVIVGGGDTAMESASFMTKMTKQITIIQINPKLTASAAMQERVINNKDITIIYNSTVKEIRGDGTKITSVIVHDQKTNKEQEIKTNAVFLAIGLDPNTSIFKGKLELEKNGYLKLTNKTKTSVPGIFGAGDLADSVYRQAVTAAGDGCMAALDVERFLHEQKS